MKAMILAAGRGERMGMLTANEPLLRDAPRMRKVKPTDAERNASIRFEEVDASAGSHLHVVAAE